MKITAEEARMWGREAYDMGLTLERACQDIRDCGCPEYLIPQVELAYDLQRQRALHREA